MCRFNVTQVQQSMLAALRRNIFGVLLPKHVEDQGNLGGIYNFMKFLCVVLSPVPVVVCFPCTFISCVPTKPV